MTLEETKKLKVGSVVFYFDDERNIPIKTFITRIVDRFDDPSTYTSKIIRQYCVKHYESNQDYTKSIDDIFLELHDLLTALGRKVQSVSFI